MEEATDPTVGPDMNHTFVVLRVTSVILPHIRIYIVTENCETVPIYTPYTILIVADSLCQLFYIGGGSGGGGQLPPQPLKIWYIAPQLSPVL